MDTQALCNYLKHNPKKCDQFLHLDKQRLTLRMHLQLRHGLEIGDQKTSLANFLGHHQDFCMHFEVHFHYLSKKKKKYLNLNSIR